jgi:hypothetical protein
VDQEQPAKELHQTSIVVTQQVGAVLVLRVAEMDGTSVLVVGSEPVTMENGFIEIAHR